MDRRVRLADHREAAQGKDPLAGDRTPPWGAEALKVTGLPARCTGVRFERLVIDSGDHTLAIDLHPRFTVLTGMGSLERDALTTEFIGALSSSRPGVHLELQADSGVRFAVFRPEGSDPRVVDIDHRLDVTSQFLDPNGRIDLLARANLDTHQARRLMHVDGQQLAESVEGDRLILALASVDQSELWSTADDLLNATRYLDSEAEDIGSSADDAEAVARIEARHADLEAAQAQAEQVRKVNFLVSGIAALFAIPATQILGLPGLVACALIAVAAVVVSIVYWRRAEAASRAEVEALAAAGAQSYLGFHLQRVNGLLGSDAKRRRLLAAAERRRNAEARWNVLAGSTTLEWALEHKAEITGAARSRELVQTVDRMASGSTVTAAAHVLRERLASVRAVGPGQETFPLLLDEPFASLDEEAVAPLLSLLLEQSQHQQILLLTASASIASWARLESMTGALEVVEPTPHALT